MEKRKHLPSLISLLLAMLTAAALAFPAFSVPARADIGPKPSVQIHFENMGDELCYGTLLSREKSAGPASVWDGEEEHALTDENYPSSGYLPRDIWEAFVRYKDPDGYFFLQEGWEVSKTKDLVWGYYPPLSFKILLYYPETETFVSSGIYGHYAFDSYYTVNMADVKIVSVEYDDTLSTNKRIDAYRSYQYRQELVSLAVRTVLTIVIEMAVALLFGFRSGRPLLVLALVNVVTQILLNVLLNIINYASGSLAFTVSYVLLELAVFAVEAVLYCTVLKKVTEKQRTNRYYVLYSLAANSVSFAAGFFLAELLPGIF